MSDLIIYPLLFVFGAIASGLMILSAFIGKKAGYATSIVIDFAAGTLGFSLLPVTVLLFRDGVFTVYVFLFYLLGFFATFALARLIKSIKSRRDRKR